jgi:hypothetical protein
MIYFEINFYWFLVCCFFFLLGVMAFAAVCIFQVPKWIREWKEMLNQIKE